VRLSLWTCFANGFAFAEIFNKQWVSTIATLMETYWILFTTVNVKYSTEQKIHLSFSGVWGLMALFEQHLICLEKNFLKRQGTEFSLNLFWPLPGFFNLPNSTHPTVLLIWFLLDQPFASCFSFILLPRPLLSLLDPFTAPSRPLTALIFSRPTDIFYGHFWAKGPWRRPPGNPGHNTWLDPHKPKAKQCKICFEIK
jgi:hypothetical protein